MDFDFNKYTTDQKYEFLKTIINMAQLKFANSNDSQFAFQEQEGYVNLLGARGFSNGKPCTSTNTLFDDTMFVIYKKNNNKHVEAFQLSTEYGSAGTALLRTGQHKYVLHYHKEGLANHLNLATAASYVSNRKYRALEPDASGVEVLRENPSSRNLQKDPTENYETGNLSINIHYGGKTTNPQAWSQGCQVLRGWKNYKKFIKLVEADHSIQGSINNELATVPANDGNRAVIYTLIEGSFFEEVAALPLDFGNGYFASQKRIKAYYEHTEKKYAGGYFPVGTNTVWHGGVHLHCSTGSQVYASATGKIVGAFLPDDKNVANGHYGSRNFILMEHKIKNKSFYSLYMHLNHETCDANNKKLHKLQWLYKKNSETRLKVKINNLNYRSAPQAKASTLLGQMNKNEELKIIDESQAPWIKVQRKDSDTEVYIFKKNSWVEEIKKTQHIFDKNLLKQLKDGQVVRLDRAVNVGEPIWYSGEYGSASYRTGLLHWQMMSSKNLFAKWPKVKDSDSDFNMDAKQILSIIEQEDGIFESDDILTASELKNFYKNNSNALKLREYVCKFCTEWGVDLDKAIPKMKDRWITYGLKDRIAPYVWWDKAKSMGISMPSNKHVFHYNPIRFVEALFKAELK